MRGRDRVALVGCIATIAWSALALGGAVRWAAVIGALLAIAAAVPYVTSRRSPERISPLSLLIFVAIGFTTLQLLPLPSPIASLLAESKLELVTDNAAAWGESAPAFVLASYDPPATLVELAKLCGYAALAFAALRLAAQERGRRMLAMTVVGAALAVTVVAFAHEAVGATSIYGIFEMPDAPTLVGPLINENHLASLMAIAAAVALGLAVASTGVHRLGWLAALAVCAGMALFSGSRGGAIGLAVALVTTIAIVLMQGRSPDRERKPIRTWIPIVTIAGCSAILLAVFTASRLHGELGRTETTELVTAGGKYEVWSKSLAMLESHAWLGTGRGAFEPAFTRWSGVGQTTFSHAENSYVQAVVDWGIPGAAALALALSALLVAATRRWQKSPIEAGAFGAIASIAVHELADFSLELPVIASVAIVLVAILLAPKLEPRSDSSRSLFSRARLRRVALLTLGAATCIVAATPLGLSAHATASSITGTPEERVALAYDASASHPADYLLHGAAAQALFELGDVRSFPVINRALYLNPTHGGLHRLAAVMFLRAERSAPAQSELALAVRYAPAKDRTRLLTEVAATFPDPAQAARALPLDLAMSSELVRILTSRKQTAMAFEYTRKLAALHPESAAAQRLLAEAAFRAERLDVATVAARESARIEPSVAATVILARTTARSGNPAAAVKLLHEARAVQAPSSVAEQIELMQTLADQEIASGAFDAAAATLDELLLLVPDKRGRIDVHQRRATLFDRRGDSHQAAYEREQIRTLERER